MCQTLRLTDSYIELDNFTFHPDLPGLAFLGMWSQAGSYPTPLEQQARFLTYTWSGERERSPEQMRAGLQACRAEGHHSKLHNQAEMALRFARLNGTDPLATPRDPKSAARLRAAPTTGMLYRLTGPDALGPTGVKRSKAGQ